MQTVKSFFGQTGGYILIVILIVGLVVFIQARDDDEDQAVEQQTTQETTEASALPIDESSPADDAVAPAVVEEATLVAVNDYRGSGDATRSYEQGQFLHEVIADLDDPAEGKFYEGWIVGDQIVSTGKLENEDGNIWSLIFTSDEDLRDLDDIVITEETEANGLDGIPETHVLEGSF